MGLSRMATARSTAPVHVRSLELSDGTQQQQPDLIVPDSATKILASLGRRTALNSLQWPNAATEAVLTVEVSYNGGQSWAHLGSVTATGGTVTRKGGAEATRSSVTTGLNPGTGRRVRGSVAVTGGPLVTEYTLEAL